MKNISAISFGKAAIELEDSIAHIVKDNNGELFNSETQIKLTVEECKEYELSIKKIKVLKQLSLLTEADEDFVHTLDLAIAQQLRNDECESQINDGIILIKEYQEHLQNIEDYLVLIEDRIQSDRNFVFKNEGFALIEKCDKLLKIGNELEDLASDFEDINNRIVNPPYDDIE